MVENRLTVTGHVSANRHCVLNIVIRWPTSVTCKQTGHDTQKQKSRHKRKNLTAQKQKSRHKNKSHGTKEKNRYICHCHSHITLTYNCHSQKSRIVISFVRLCLYSIFLDL